MLLEIFLIFIISFLIGYCLDTILANASDIIYNDGSKGFHIGKKRIHHNILGYLLVILSLFYYLPVLMGLGLGMIAGHGLREKGFWFLESLR